MKLSQLGYGLLVILIAASFGGCTKVYVGTPMYDHGVYTLEEWEQVRKEKAKEGYVGAFINTYTDRTVIVALPTSFLKKSFFSTNELSLSPNTELIVLANACDPNLMDSGLGWKIKYLYIYTDGRRDLRWREDWLYIDKLPGTDDSRLSPRYRGRGFDWFCIFEDKYLRHR